MIKIKKQASYCRNLCVEICVIRWISINNYQEQLINQAQNKSQIMTQINMEIFTMEKPKLEKKKKKNHERTLL